MITKQVILIFLGILFSTITHAQQKKIVIDSLTNEPIEFVNVLSLNLRKGVISNQNGEFIFDEPKINISDTLVLSHIGYKTLYILFREFQSKDTLKLEPKQTFLSEVFVKTKSKEKKFKNKTTLGYFQHKYEGALYMRPGEQIGLIIENKANLTGKISEVQLHFEKLVTNATFRLRIKKINKDQNIGEELLPEGIVIKPNSLKPIINLSEYDIPLTEYGVFVFIDYLGDGKNYSNRIYATPIKYALTNRHTGYNTFNNFMDAYKWNRWNVILRDEKNPQNAQIQIKVLF